MCLARGLGSFCAAVAGAPVTSWDGYDTHYTERYMGTPAAAAAAYDAASALATAHALRGALMLVHGGLDENVHWRHSARLVGALTQAGKGYELLFFPDERHMPRGLPERLYMERRVLAFLGAQLDAPGLLFAAEEEDPAGDDPDGVEAAAASAAERRQWVRRARFSV